MKRVMVIVSLLAGATACAAFACSKEKSNAASTADKADKGDSKKETAKQDPPAKQEPAPPANAAPGPQKITGQGYTLTIDPPADAAVNGQGVVKIAIHPADGYHVNKDFPSSLKVTPPDGVDVAKAEQTSEDAKKLDETEADFEVAFTPKAAGDKAFAATFKFAVCTATTCDPKREKLAWNVTVK
jgi:hypothetical protein